MTNEEAIRELTDFKSKYWDGMPEETIDVALRALKRQIGDEDWGYTTHHGKRFRVCPYCSSERDYDMSTGWNYCPVCGAKVGRSGQVGIITDEQDD